VIERIRRWSSTLHEPKLPGLGPVQFPQNLSTRHTVAVMVGPEANGT
jgi:hypothetical protein